MKVARVADLEWVDRVNVDNWPSRIGLYYRNDDFNLMVRLVEFPAGAIEPRHIHPGHHGTTVLEGHAIGDGVTLKPLDVILGPSNEPHGPFAFPEGCRLVSMFQGNDFHNEAEALSAEKNYRLIQSGEFPWRKDADGNETKTLIDRGLGRMLIEARRYPAGAEIAPDFLAGLVFDGEARVGGETAGRLDVVHRNGGDRGTIAFPKGATLLTLTMR
jgi:quercetin dioxygenase-like cupin family protein